MEASALVDKLVLEAEQNLLEQALKPVDPGVQNAADKHFAAPRWASAREVCLFFGQHVGEYITYEMVMNATGLNKRQVYRAFKVLVGRSQRFPQA